MDKILIALTAFISGLLIASGLIQPLEFIGQLGLSADQQTKIGAVGLVLALAAHIIGGGSLNPFKD